MRDMSFASATSQFDRAMREVQRRHTQLSTLSSAQLRNLLSRRELSEQMRVLMHDWERRARTFDPSLFLPSTGVGVLGTSLGNPETFFGAEKENQIPSWTYSWNLSDVSNDWIVSTQQWSQQTTYWADELHHVFDLLWDRARNMARPLPHVSHPPDWLASFNLQRSELLSVFEAKWDALSHRGREGAAQLVERASHAVTDLEDILYAKAVELAHGGQKLISYHTLPPVWRNNDFIHSGYRFIPVNQWRLLIGSAFRVHNETGSIQTHLWGLVMILFLFWMDAGLDDNTTAMDRFIQTLYLIAAAKCLTCSVSWHVMAGCSDQQWFLCFACIDYTGIAMLVAASLMTLVYNGFYCQSDVIAAYAVCFATLGCTMGFIPWYPWFDDPKNRTLKIMLFIFMALSGVLPFTHAALLHGLGPVIEFYKPVIPSVASYITGVVLYGFRIPECWAPGRFDIIGHSHQLWHIAIVLAILLHYRAILIFHASRFEFSCVAVPESASKLGYVDLVWRQLYSLASRAFVVS